MSNFVSTRLTGAEEGALQVIAKLAEALGG